MADPVPASETVVDNDDAEYLYSETSAGNFRKVETTKFVTALGLTGEDEGTIIYVDSAGAYAYLAPGDDDDILTLASGIPSWAEPPSIGAMQYLSTTTASGGSTLEITDGFSSDYDEYVIQLIGIRSGTDNQTLLCTLSENGGRSWLGTGYSYSSTLMNASAVTPSGADSALAMNVVINVGSAAGDAVSGELKLFNVSASKTTLTGQFHGFDSSGANSRITMFGGSQDGSSARVNGVRLTCGSAIYGSARLYGIRNS
jgi:hypothetical protein